MKLKTHIKTAARNLLMSRMRSFLAMLSIMVGTISVVALVSSGELAAEEALKQFTALGTDLMSITIQPPEKKKESGSKISLEMLYNLPKVIPEIKKISPYTSGYMSASKGNTSLDIGVIGSNQELASIVNIKIKQGRFINNLDKSQNFCVIGQGVFKNLKILNPIGEKLVVGKAIYTIIGVAATWPENGFFHENINNDIVIPIESFSVLQANYQLSNVVMKISKQVPIDTLKTRINEYFSKAAPGYRVDFQSAKELIASMSKQQEIFTLLLGLIGAIALMVGGIGVMNIMLASVSERRNEIGLRLALGAQPKDIQLMFLMEATLLALIGGSLGVFFGILGTIVIAKVAGWTFSLFFIPPIIGLSMSVMISLFFGFYPAYKASLLNPIDALRGNV